MPNPSSVSAAAAASHQGMYFVNQNAGPGGVSTVAGGASVTTCQIKIEPNQNYMSMSPSQQQQQQLPPQGMPFSQPAQQQQQPQQQQQQPSSQQQQAQVPQPPPPQMRHRNAATSTGNAPPPPHHGGGADPVVVLGSIGDQHKLTQQQLQHQQHLIRAQQVMISFAVYSVI